MARAYYEAHRYHSFGFVSQLEARNNSTKRLIHSMGERLDKLLQHKLFQGICYVANVGLEKDVNGQTGARYSTFLKRFGNYQ